MKLSFLLWITSLLPQPLADQTCLATTVYLEARSEPAAGQMAVAEVALRRRESGRWGNSICDVVLAKGQFAPTTTNPAYVIANPKAWTRAWHIAQRSIAMWSLPRDQRKFLVPDADHFILADSTSYWVKGEPVATIGAHNFYRIN